MAQGQLCWHQCHHIDIAMASHVPDAIPACTLPSPRGAGMGRINPGTFTMRRAAGRVSPQGFGVQTLVPTELYQEGPYQPMQRRR